MYSLKLSRQTVLMAEAALESRGTAVLLQVITVFKKKRVQRLCNSGKHLRNCIDRKLGNEMPYCLTFILFCSFIKKQKRCKK